MRRKLSLVQRSVPVAYYTSVYSSLQYTQYITMYQCVCVFLLLHAKARFSPAPVVFSLVLGRGARRWPTCTPRRKFGSRAGSVARALGVQSRGDLASNHVVASAELVSTAEQDNRKPAILVYFLTSATAVKGSNMVTTITSSFSSVLQLRTLLCVCGPLLRMHV